MEEGKKHACGLTSPDAPGTLLARSGYAYGLLLPPDWGRQCGSRAESANVVSARWVDVRQKHLSGNNDGAGPSDLTLW